MTSKQGYLFRNPFMFKRLMISSKPPTYILPLTMPREQRIPSVGVLTEADPHHALKEAIVTTKPPFSSR